MFANRTEAGRRLAERLVERGVEADIVLAIPRGGLPVGRPVADALGVPLDVVVAQKLGAPKNPELAVGAVAADGSLWLNDELVDWLSVPESYVDRERDREAANARAKVDSYRGGDPLPELAGKRVVVVDDGLATGATAQACLRQVRAAGAAHVVLAVPVAPVDAPDRFAEAADEFVAVETPVHFVAVGGAYRDFSQVPDEEARRYLTP
ncbi:phosphoribosyltransferase [Halobium salinum]|uniref:Phosphoribosyltransferase n=1 Tax=Halobium salinum TaxID=1364940 RepID=A0ABD5PFQ9_9EURY|nr:phosphoribosyltransferase family protein [Halobium salinum]